MPFIVAGQPTDRGLGRALSESGRRLTAVSGELADRKRQMDLDREHTEEINRRLDIEETRAKASLLGQVNRAGERQAEMQGAEEGYEGERRKQTAQAFGQGLRGALESSGGVLGPFGTMSPRALAGGAKAAAESEARMAGKKALASQMTPAAARAYLTREAAEETKQIQARGYQMEAEAIQNAVLEGRLTEADGKAFVKELQGAIATGKPPGGIEKRISKAYDLHAKTMARMEAWADADKQAATMIDTLRQMAASVQDGVDPESGKSLKGEATKRLAQARVEWNRTREGPTGVSRFRQQTDPEASLAGLQRILFEAQAEADPDLFMAEDEQGERARAIGPPSAQQKVGMGISDPDWSMRQRGGSQARAGAQQDAGGVSSGQAAGKPRRGLARRVTGAEDEQQLRVFVQDRAAEVLSARDTRSGVVGLLQAVATDLGLRPDDPKVVSIVKDELDRAASGKAPRDAR